MTAHDSPHEPFRHILERITAGAAGVPDHEKIGYIKGAIASVPGIPEPDRAALFDLIVCAGTGVGPARTSPPPNVNINQTIAPQQIQKQIQTASPTVRQDTHRDAPSHTQVFTAIIGAAALIASSVIGVRCAARPRDDRHPGRDTAEKILQVHRRP